MNSEIKVLVRENGEIQRVQVVRWDDWSQLDFLRLKGNSGALDCFRDIYKNYLVPTCPWIFPQMVMFQLPEDVEVELGFESEKYGKTNDRLTTASVLLEQGVKIRGGKPVFTTVVAEKLWRELETRGCVHIVCGKIPSTKIIPVGDFVGYMSECETNARMKVNANFFIMDPFDCATIYDQVGVPFGLCVKDGKVLNPPSFEREALLVKKDGSVSIREMDVCDLEIEIRGVRYKHGENAYVYTRPANAKTPKKNGVQIVVVGRKVVAVKNGGSVPVPASGYVIRVKDEKSEVFKVSAGDEVIYHGLEDVAFGIQVGNSIMRDGVKTDKFISRFYNIYHLERVPFPPSLYPMNFEKARAARIALGADKDGKPVVFWAEGKGKLSYTEGEDSTGASLMEMAEIASDLGLQNVINLDGGGSAQILLRNKRSLLISDRNKKDNSEAERLVPMGLVVR